MPITATAESASVATLAFKYHCMVCHGAVGDSSDPRDSNLAGQHASCIEARLTHFRSAAEPQNQITGQAAPLADAEITALATYFSAQSRRIDAC